MDEPLIDRDGILQQLERVLSSSVFRRADRSSALLRFIVEQTLDGQADRLKEYTLGAEALGRGDSFDPRTDPVVRAEASRLRTRLDQYYETIGGNDPLLLTLPKGTYVPQFTTKPAPVEDAPSALPPDLQSSRSRSRLNQWIPWSFAIVAIALAAAVWIRGRPHTERPASFVQFEVELKSDGVLASDVGTAVVVSPDGTRVVFVSRTADGRTHLNTRRLDQPSAMALPGTEGARGPFVSPDGRWVGFWADGKLKKSSLDGGSPVILCDASDLLGASWVDSDTIIAALGAPGKLWRIPAVADGRPQVAIDLSAESTLVRWPQVLPGGQFVMYTASTGAGADRSTIEVQSVQGRNRQVLVRGGAFGRYLTSGHLVYVNQGTLYAVQFDPTTLAVHGAPVPVLDDVSYSPLFGYAQVDVSLTGTLVYRKGAESALSVVDWIDRSGQRTTLLAKPGRYAWLRMSPDGRRLAVTATESGAANILVHDPLKGDTSRITRRPGDYTGLTWLPDGASLLFGGADGVAWIPADRPGDSTRFKDVRGNQTPWSVAPDGRRLAYYDRSPETGFDLWTVAVTQHNAGVELGTPEPFLQTEAFEVYPSFSPDGRWITYASNESGAWEVYVRRFPDNGTKIRVSSSGGSVPRWSRNGRELLYRTEAQRIMVVTYTSSGDTFVPSAPRPWSPHSLADTGVLPNFDIAPDGERVLALMPVARPEEQQTVNHVTFMLNVSEQIRNRMTAR
jgi:eukaryotic-like serine/threonine-protein kinase